MYSDAVAGRGDGLASPEPISTAHFRSHQMTTEDGKWVPTLSIAGALPDKFPPGSTVRVVDQSIGQTLRQIWAAVRESKFQIARQDPPVLPLTHRWIDASTAHGVLLAERGIVTAPTEFLRSQRYWSSVLIVTMDADTAAAEAKGAAIETIVPHTLVVQAGRVFSKLGHGKHSAWREIVSVECDPELEPFRERVVAWVTPRLPT